MNLSSGTGTSAVFSADIRIPRATFRAARALACPVCAALRGEECACTTVPVSVPVAAGTDAWPVHGYHAARLDLAGTALAATLGASAVVWDNGHAPRLAASADAGSDREAAREMLCAAKERLDNIGFDLCELAAALSGPRGCVVAALSDSQGVNGGAA